MFFLSHIVYFVVFICVFRSYSVCYVNNQSNWYVMQRNLNRTQAHTNRTCIRHYEQPVILYSLLIYIY